MISLSGEFTPESPWPETGARLFLERWAGLFGMKPGLPDLHLARRVDTPGGATMRFSQIHEGVPVFGGEVLVGLARNGSILRVVSAYHSGLPVLRPAVIVKDQALRIAERELGLSFDPLKTLSPAIVHGDKDFPGDHLAWDVHGFTRNPPGDWHVFVDSETGAVVRTINQIKQTGDACTSCDPLSDNQCGDVFFENPVDAADDTSLLDADNVDAWQSSCFLGSLTSATSLTGLYVDTSISGVRVSPPYSFDRSSNQRALDELTVYYHITRAKLYLNTLGFAGVMNFPIDADAHDAGIGDQSYYSPGLVEVHFGEGGVDDGQDPDIIYHEYGHAIQDNQVPGFGSTVEGGAMGEGFGDYWAAALTDLSSTTAIGAGCVGSWDAVSYNPYTGAFGSGCLRRVDGMEFYPRDKVFQVHSDGEMWSAALWGLRSAVGATVADSLVIQGHVYQTPTSGFIDGADSLITADQALYAGAHEGAIHAAMASYGIPRSAVPASSAGLTDTVSFICETTHNYSNNYYKECTFTQPGSTRLRAHFSRFDTEEDWDFVYVSDGQYNQVQDLSGCPFGNCTTSSGYSAAVAGDTIVVRMKSDTSFVDWGFRIDEIEFTLKCLTAADCSDGSPCTVDSCSGGLCSNTPGNAGMECRSAAGACDVAETCDGLTAPCPSDVSAPDGTLCNAGCSDYVCQSGICDPPAEESIDLTLLGDNQTLGWTTVGSSALYDLLLGSVVTLPAGDPGESCLASGLTVSTLSHATDPAQGEIWYYLVRSSCGAGDYGLQSDATPRLSSICP